MELFKGDPMGRTVELGYFPRMTEQEAWGKARPGGPADECRQGVPAEVRAYRRRGSGARGGAGHRVRGARRPDRAPGPRAGPKATRSARRTSAAPTRLRRVPRIPSATATCPRSSSSSRFPATAGAGRAPTGTSCPATTSAPCRPGSAALRRISAPVHPVGRRAAGRRGAVPEGRVTKRMRADDLRVERAAMAATELSLARCAELYLALPVVDHGADLFAYQADPFRVARGFTR